MSKARMPYFQMYAADWLASGKVAAMTTEEAGAHFFLMCQAWLADPPASIPDDDDILARWARLSPERWGDAKAQVLAAWEYRDGRWFQPRMSDEWQRAVDANSAHAEAGRKGGLRSAQARLKRGLSEAQPFSDTDTDTEKDISGDAPLAPTRRKPPVAAGVKSMSVEEIRLEAIDRMDWLGSSKGIQFNPKTREWRGITEADRKGWSESCPAVSLVAELARAGAWIVANPAKGRKSNYRRFLNGWLDRCQERGGSHGNGNGFGIPRNGASTRRESRRADEFPEQIILPTA